MEKKKPNRKKLVFTLLLLLVLTFTYQMIVDDKLSDDTQMLLSMAAPTTDLENNVFIHMMALGDSDENAYQKHLNAYKKAARKTKIVPLESNEKIGFPAPLLSSVHIPEMINCFLNEHVCIEKLEEHKEVIANKYQHQINTVTEFALNHDSYSYGQLENSAITAYFDSVHQLNLFASIAILQHIQNNEFIEAERLLFSYYSLLRRIVESSIDTNLTVVYIVSYKTVFAPLLEQLILSNHKFTLPLISAFSSIPMSEITLLEVRISEINFFASRLLSIESPKVEFCERCNFKIGYMPNMTLNLVTEYLRTNTLHESTLKIDYLTAYNSLETKRLERDGNFLTFVKNPRNFIGVLLAQAGVPRFFGSGIDYAENDLYLMLFKLAILSQSSPIEELVTQPEFIDPYTGNLPYIEQSKVCYPTWPELDYEENQKLATCIRFAN